MGWKTVKDHYDIKHIVQVDTRKEPLFEKELVEEQGEQKPTDKLEPKFKVGDWVRAIRSGNIFKILSINDGLYRVLCYDGVEANYPIEIEKDLAYWTIQDAKRGDILYEQETKSILLVHERSGNWLQTLCDYWMVKEKFHVEFPYENYGFVQQMSLEPATKEQRGLLFQKMKEEGYEWDEDKKELKKFHVIDEGGKK